MVERFEDPAGGGFFDTVRADTRGLLGQNAKPIQDAPTPAPNAVAALDLLRLAAITAESRYAAAADRTLTAFAGSAEELGLFAATYLRAVDLHLHGACRIVVADTTTNGRLAATALAAYRPRRVVLRAAESPVPGVRPPVCLVCAGTVCAAPVTDAASLRTTLESFGRPG